MPMQELDAPDETQALTKLLAVSLLLGECTDLDEVLNTVIDAMRSFVRCERVTVFVHDAKSALLVTRVAHGLSSSAIRIPDTAGIAGACAQARKVINIKDAYADERFDRSFDAATGFRTRTILAVPLIDDEGALVGVAQILNRLEGSFSERDELVVRSLAAQAAVAVRRATLIEDRMERMRMQDEIDVARLIQQRSFPQGVPSIDRYELVGRSAPSQEVGGDAFDLVPLGDIGVVPIDFPCERAMLLIADATGHGVGPALSSIQTRGMIRLALRFGHPLPAIARQVNEQLIEDLPSGRFVTAWLGLLDARSDTLQSFSAGQGPIYVYRRASDSFESIDTNAPPMGIMNFDESFCATQTVQLESGDVFVAITDGYYEAPEAGGGNGQFGEERVFRLIRALRDAPLATIVDELDRSVLAYHGAPFTPDDRTAVLVRRSK